jgi:hypothetical protein
MALIPQYDVGRLMIQSRLLWMQSGLLWAKICRRVPGALRHYNQIVLSVLVAAGLSALGAAQSTADTIYTYTGNPFTTAVSPYTTNDFISGFIVLATPLGNDVPPSQIDPLNFSFTDGIITIPAPGNPLGTVFDMIIQTDSKGLPMFWTINIESRISEVNHAFVSTFLPGSMSLDSTGVCDAPQSVRVSLCELRLTRV